jgi:hypothetical protein
MTHEPETKGDKKDWTDEAPFVLTGNQPKINGDSCKGRESQFGIIHTKFEALKQPFYEVKKQHNHLVNYTIDPHNYELKIFVIAFKYCVLFIVA